MLFLLLPVHAQSGNAKNDQRQKNANATQNATPKTVPTQTSPQTADKPATKQPDREYPVSVSKIPDVTIHRDLIDYLMLVLTAVLATVGIVGTCYALQTLRAIKTEVRTAVIALKHSASLAHAAQKVAEGVLVNANIAKEHADATHKTVDTMMIGQRAWIIVTMGVVPDFTPEPGKLQILWISPTFTNCGKTPARIVRIRAREEEIPNGQQLPEPPIYEGVGVSPARFDGTAFLPPNASIQPINIGMVPAAFIAIRQGHPVLYLYGFVDYLDVYDRQWTTRFCFIYHIQSGFNPISEGFYVGGPAVYNEAT